MTKVTFLCFYFSTAPGGIKMEIDKAIEILQTIVQTGEYEGDPDDSTAINLGIEALKLERQHREYPEYYGYLMLPGETKD